ncbi:MAG: hypothetical protein ACRDRN_11850 [Sciscionella sp.]
MPTYRYVATNLLTGQILADNLPVVVQSASRVIKGAGRLSGYLPLQQDGKSNHGFINALTPRKSVLWILQDEFPIGGWVVTDTPHQSILNHQLPIQGQSIEWLFSTRHITSALAFNRADLFDIGRGLVSYGTQGTNGRVAGLSLVAGQSGITDSLTFGVSNTLQAAPNVYTGTYADNQPVLDGLTSASAAGNWEWTFDPVIAGSGFGWNFRQGYPAIGQWNSPRPFALTFPGNAIDYARPIMGSNAANWIIATSASNGTGQLFTSQYPHGVDAADLAAGFPRQEAVVMWPGVGVTSQAQIDAYADLLLGQYTAGTMVPAVVLGGETEPLLRELGLGDKVTLSATSELDPAVNGQPGLQISARISGWTLTPPAEKQPEKVLLTLGALVGQVSTGAVS